MLAYAARIQHVMNAGRPDEWLTREILFVARLFAHHYDTGTRRSFTENRLRCVPVKFARHALLGKIAQLCQRRTG